MAETTKTTEAVVLQDISKAFFPGRQSVQAVAGVSVTIQENEFFTLLGPSGCGKTTLLRLIAGLEQPDQGRIFLSGRDVIGMPAHKRPVNTVFQNYALFPHLTVAENIAFGLKMQKRPAAEVKATVQDMLRLVRLEGLLDRKPAQLSGGQQQRVALARALANHPKVLLLDEPLSALDSKLRKNMQQELKRLQKETQITFIFVTHDQEEALSMSDRVAVMDHGRIVQTGTPLEIYRRPATRFVASFIGVCNFVPSSLLGMSGVSGTQETQEARGPQDMGFRPEDARLLPATEASTVKGVLRNVIYKGATTDYLVQIHQGPDVVISSDQALSFPCRPGDSIGIHIDPQRLITCVA